MMWLGAVGGLRGAECAGLTVGCLDLLTGWDATRQQLARSRLLEAPKTEASRRRSSGLLGRSSGRSRTSGARRERTPSGKEETNPPLTSHFTGREGGI